MNVVPPIVQREPIDKKLRRRRRAFGIDIGDMSVCNVEIGAKQIRQRHAVI